MTTAVAILAGGVGALLRYGVAGVVQRRTGSTWPWGTAVVNVIGAVALGVLVALHATGRTSEAVLVVAGTGFVGGFTTFSTWMVETVRIAEPGTTRQLWAAVLNVVGPLAVGVVAAATTGWLLGP